METTTKKITKQAIYATLRKAGYTRSEEMTTAVRGWHKWTAGYRVYGFSVSHNTWSSIIEDDEKKKFMVGCYQSALNKAGFQTELSETGLSVRVTGRN